MEESQEDVLTLWGKYVDLRLRSANNEDDAIAKKRELVKEIVEETKAVKELTDAQIMSINAKARIKDIKTTTPTVAGFDTTAAFKDTPLAGIESMSSAYDGLTAAVERSKEAQQKQNEIILAQREGWANLGASIGDTIAQTIAGGQPLLQSLSRITSTIINQLEQITLARMVANNAKFGIGGILAAAAGFGIVKGLFNKLGKDNSVSTFQNNSYGSMAQPIGVTVYSRQRGTDLVGVGVEENRIRKRTRV